MNSTWIIGDIHGCIRTFRYLVEDVVQLGSQDRLVLLGDLIDRGPDSKAVADYCMQLRNQGIRVVAIKGNHEALLLRAHESDEQFELWMRNSGLTTLRAFGIGRERDPGPTELERIPALYRTFFEEMPLFYASDKVVCVHAGLNPSLENPLEDTETLLWTRTEAWPERFMNGRKLVHGHTICPVTRILAQQDDPERKVISLDAGCIYAYPGFGYLAAMEETSGEIRVTKNREM